MKIIALQDYENINYQETSRSKKLFLVPKIESAKKVYLALVSDKTLKTDVWQSLLNDLKKAF